MLCVAELMTNFKFRAGVFLLFYDVCVCVCVGLITSIINVRQKIKKTKGKRDRYYLFNDKGYLSWCLETKLNWCVSIWVAHHNSYKRFWGKLRHGWGTKTTTAVHQYLRREAIIQINLSRLDFGDMDKKIHLTLFPCNGDGCFYETGCIFWYLALSAFYTQ